METAAIASVLEEELPRIQRAFEERGFVPAGELADRHGALQLTFTKETTGLARLVLLNEAVGTGEDDYRGSIDVVVQADDRFERRRVVASHSRDAFAREIAGEAIAAAVALADTLRNEDLAASFALRAKDRQELSPRELKAFVRALMLQSLDGLGDETKGSVVRRLLKSALTAADGTRLKVAVERIRNLDRRLAAKRAQRNQH